MRYLVPFILSLLMLPLSMQAQKTQHFEAKNFAVDYDMKDGRFNGAYKSYHKNEKVKAEGTLANNQRIGKWTIYNDAGVKVMERVYASTYDYTRTYPKVKKGGPIPVLAKTRYVPQLNEHGFISTFYPHENMIVMAKRLWRNVTPATNEVLFKDDRLYMNILSGIENDSLILYGNDEFRTILTPDEVKTIQSTTQNIIGYRIKEDWFIDNDRVLSERIIIGIAPVVKNSETNTVSELCWIYMPQLRYTIGLDKLEEGAYPDHIKTLDDYFFYDFYTGKIYKESNVFDREIASNGITQEEIDYKAKSIELGLFEAEHDYWISISTQ